MPPDPAPAVDGEAGARRGVPAQPPPRPAALGWLDDATIAGLHRSTVSTASAPSAPSRLRARPTTPAAAPAADSLDAPDEAAPLIVKPPHRTPVRPGVLLPITFAVLVLVVYAAVTLLWPLNAIAPQVRAVAVHPAAAPVAAMSWPGQGSAAVAVTGFPGGAASAAAGVPMASITKVVTALVVLDRMPLAKGEQGEQFHFTARDRAAYWQYRKSGESALDVPVGGALSEYQLLQGMLIGSAGNYADRLVASHWPNNAVFAAAANAWLTTHGVTGITVADATGFDPHSTATPDGLLQLAAKALGNPVIAEIVATQEVTLPGAGVVKNTNLLLADPGVLGVKTGTLVGFDLLSAKDVRIGGTTVRLTTAVLGQRTDAARYEASRALFAQLEQQLQPHPALAAGTVVGTVTTRWGDSVRVVTAKDAAVVLWNGAAATPSTSFALNGRTERGASAGALTLTGPVNATTVDAVLAEAIAPPSAWWRLTHPLDLFGLIPSQ